MRVFGCGRSALCGLFALACGEAEPRAQLLVTVDTDLPLVGHALERPELSYDAAIDALRVDIYDLELSHITFREHIVPDERQWPVSFGIPSEGLPDRILIQLRAFNAELSTPGDVRGKAALDPLPTASVDRLVQIELPSDGIARRHVLLSGDCYARPAKFSPLRTCVDAARLEVTPDVTDEPSATTRAGSWAVAIEQPCVSPPPEDSVCIPGGFTLLGDEKLRGTADGFLIPFDPVPLRPVRVRAFFMDVAEVSVGRFRALLKDSPQSISELPEPFQPTGVQAGCTWLGPDDGANDLLPLSCVTGKTASEVCAALNGRLPTEAEWEHAARGRGRRWRYPWGDEWPECCTAVAGGQNCGRNAPEPSGNSTNALGCATRDVSRDGVFDLAGNLAEITSDRLVSYAEGCWDRAGVTVAPSCNEPEHAPLVVRGGVYNEPATFGAAPVRRLFTEAYGVRAIGIRCVHADGAER